MATLRQLILRLLNVARPRRAEQELARELDAHLALLADDYQRRGLSPDEARTAARRTLGGVARANDLHRDARAFAWLDDAFQDLRYAVRSLRASRGFAVVAVATLAVGIGVNAAVFTLTSAVLFRGFPSVRDNDRLVYIASEGSACCVSYPDFEDWRAQSRSFAGLAVVHGVPVTLGDERGFPESYDATEVSAATFSLIGQQPVLGRDFTEADETPGAAPVTILTHQFWTLRYDRDPGIVGRTVRLNGTPTTVIGVMPEGVAFPQKQDVWVPLVPSPEVRVRSRRDLWFVLGRLADGVSLAEARAEMAGLGRRLAHTYQDTNRDFRPEVVSFNEFFVGARENLIYGAMWGAVGFVLLIACANLANLTLARAAGRSREMSVRLALGAGRGRIVRQLLTENLMLSGLGGLLGWGLASWTVRLYALAERGPGMLPWRVLDYTMDGRVLAYVVLMTVGTGILCGLAPALRLSGVDLQATLKDGDRGTTGGRRGKALSKGLVAGEMALAVVLLAGAGVLIRSVLHVSSADLGVPPEQAERIVTARLELPEERYAGPEAWRSFHDRLEERLGAVPGVDAVAVASQLPAWGASRVAFELEGETPPSQADDALRPMLPTVIVGPQYFRTLGATVSTGRAFRRDDGPQRVPVAIVNRRFASQYWPGEDPLGKRLRLFAGSEPEAWRTVVGVVSNIVQNDATRQAFEPLLYVPVAQRPASGMWVMVRAAGSVDGLAAALRREVQHLDADLAVWVGPFTLSERLAEAYWSRALYGRMFLGFAAIAVLLATVGLYAVVAHTVSRRTQEIGVRMAIGGTARDILALVCSEALTPVGIGVVAGLAAAAGVNRLLAAQLVQVSPADPITLLGVCGVLTLAATIGCLLPARRATRIDPVTALRAD